MTDQELNAKMWELNRLALIRFIEEHLSEEEIEEMIKEIRNEDSDEPVSGLPSDPSA
jgi:hypothetical protein